MGEKTLYLMRHGETWFNRQHRIQGWCDSPLTERGREQARAVGRELAARGVRIDHAYCSTAERAADTLKLVLAELGWDTAAACDELGADTAFKPAPYLRLKGLREMSYGDLEAQQDFLAENDPEACRTYYLQFHGESSDTVRDRMVATLTRAMLQPGHGSVLAVAHGGANFNFLRAVQDPTEELARGWGNGTVCVYDFNEDKARAGEKPNGLGAGPFALREVIRLDA